ncbi:hypothetical protein ABTM67_20545, partial [Acinetobacter baumannii]
TVTCSGTDANGFAAGGGVTGLTVNVLAGATVTDNGTAAISVNDGNAVANNGTISIGMSVNGIEAGSSNTLTNGGTIT